MNFKVGDEVLYLNEDAKGKVIHLKKEYVIIIDQDGFEREVAPNQLVKKNEFLGNSTAITPKPEDSPKVKREIEDRIEDEYIVDLHFHEIYYTDRGLSNFQKLNMQLDFAKSKIDTARKNRTKSLVFIHGKGAGVLKSELRSLVSKLDFCYYEDADWRKFGEGATKVIIL